MRKYNIELIEWLDITDQLNKNPFTSEPDMVVNLTCGIIVKQFRHLSKMVLRCSSMMGVQDSDRENSHYVDIPINCIIKRKILDSVEMEEGTKELKVRWTKK